MADGIASINHLLDQVVEKTEGQDEVSMGRIMGALDNRSYGPLLLLPGLIAVSPIGAIPGMSIVTGTLIAILAFQALIGREQPWMPSRILDFSFDRARFQRGVDKSRPWVRRVEKLLGRRLEFMHNPVVFRVGAAVCLLLALTFYPLAFVPFGVAVPGTAIILFSLGWVSRDGVALLLGFALALGAFGLAVLGWPG